MYVLAALSAALFLWACGASSVADGGITTAQMNAAIATAVQAAITPIQAQLTALQKIAYGSTVFVHFTPTASDARTAAFHPAGSPVPNATTTPSAVGTFVGADTSSVFGMTAINMVSPTHYFYCLPGGPGAHTPCLPTTIIYENPNCQLNSDGTGAFVIAGTPLTAQNFEQGVVLVAGTDGDVNAADWFMLAANQAPKADTGWSEFEQNVNVCVNISPGPNSYPAAYPITPYSTNPGNATTSGVSIGTYTTPTIGG